MGCISNVPMSQIINEEHPVFLGGGNKIINATRDIRVMGYRPTNVTNETFPKYTKLKLIGMTQNYKYMAIDELPKCKKV